MATSELQSLETLTYKSRVKVYLYPLLFLGVFTLAFLNFYPIGEQLKELMRKNLKGTGCTPDFDTIGLEWLLPRVVVSDLVVPAQCLGRAGEPLKLSFVKINFHFISFSPFGIPFRIDTELNGQPLSVYYVQGFGKRLVRLKDQALVLPRLQPLFGGNFKLSGNLTVDLSALLGANNELLDFGLRARSRDFQIPPQNLQGFTFPSMKVNDLYVEAASTAPRRITVEKLIIGDPEAPMRANFKGRIDLQPGNVSLSPLDLTGEVAFSEKFKQTVPVDMIFGSYTQKDGFYQLRVGGTLGQPMPLRP
jgi:hypothetical protein